MGRRMEVHVASHGGTLDEARQVMLEEHHIDRLGKPEEIGKLVCHLAGTPGALMQGSLVGIDGGGYHANVRMTMPGSRDKGQARPAAAMLAEFICGTPSADIPAVVRHESKRSILNFVGAALAGRRDPAVEQFLRVLRPVAGKPEAAVIGQTERLDILNAAFINAISGNTFDYDDTHQPTVIHPSAPVLPPLLALAERKGCTGAELVDAFAIGVDVACRLGLSVSPGHYLRGWHITATCGTFGAAAAAARLLRLDTAKTGHALGIAGSSAAGIVENLAAGARNVGIGNAARNGLFAALIAEGGCTAAPRAIEGVTGFARASGDEASLAELSGDLGRRWELMRNTYKAYPCGVVMASVMDASLALYADGIRGADIEGVKVTGNALLLARADRPHVVTEQNARISIQHGVAVALLQGAGGIAQFTEPSINDPAVAALRKRVTVELDASAAPMTAKITVATRDGRTRWAECLRARGSLDNPMTDADIEAKVRELSTFSGAGCLIDRIVSAAWGLDAVPDTRAFTRLIAAPFDTGSTG